MLKPALLPTLKHYYTNKHILTNSLIHFHIHSLSLSTPAHSTVTQTHGLSLSHTHTWHNISLTYMLYTVLPVVWKKDTSQIPHPKICGVPHIFCIYKYDSNEYLNSCIVLKWAQECIFFTKLIPPPPRIKNEYFFHQMHWYFQCFQSRKLKSGCVMNFKQKW